MDISSVWLILGAVIGIPVGLAIAVVAGTFILEAACAFGNVEDIRFLKALGLFVLIAVVNGFIGLGFWLVGAVAGLAMGPNLGMRTEEVQVLALLSALPLTLLVTPIFRASAIASRMRVNGSVRSSDPSR